MVPQHADFTKKRTEEVKDLSTTSPNFKIDTDSFYKNLKSLMLLTKKYLDIPSFKVFPVETIDKKILELVVQLKQISKAFLDFYLKIRCFKKGDEIILSKDQREKLTQKYEEKIKQLQMEKGEIYKKYKYSQWLIQELEVQKRQQDEEIEHLRKLVESSEKQGVYHQNQSKLSTYSIPSPQSSLKTRKQNMNCSTIPLKQIEQKKEPSLKVTFKLKEKPDQISTFDIESASQSIAIQGCENGDDICIQLSHAKWYKLTELKLVNNSISKLGCQYLLRTWSKYLKQLNLNDNMIGDKGCKFLAHNVYWEELQSLSLERNQIGDNGCIQLSYAHWNPPLTIYLKQNPVQESAKNSFSEKSWQIYF